MFLAAHIVAMVTYCVTNIMPTCSPVIGQFFDTMIVESIDKKVVIMTHQNLRLRKCWKLFWATLSLPMFSFFISNNDFQNAGHMYALCTYFFTKIQHFRLTRRSSHSRPHSTFSLFLASAAFARESPRFVSCQGRPGLKEEKRAMVTLPD